MIGQLANVLLLVGIALAQSNDDGGAGISSVVVVRPRSMSVDFWTAERMKAATEPPASVTTKESNTGRSGSLVIGPPVTIPAVKPGATSLTSRVLNARGRHVATTGRVFWSCSPGSLSCCSASVIPSSTGDVIVTAGHCVFDTTTLRWMTNCNWIFVPAYYNGTAPYGRWPARQVATLTAWARTNPDYNYDVGFVALSRVNNRAIAEVTGTQSLGFNQARNRTTYAFGYPVNLARGEVLQLCTGTPVNSRYTVNSYRGQGLSNCLMTGGCSGGPWLQQFNETAGVGVTYSLNSFTYSLAPNTINGPIFDSNVQLLWNYMTTR